jgi:hypothetical protein
MAKITGKEIAVLMTKAFPELIPVYEEKRKSFEEPFDTSKPTPDWWDEEFNGKWKYAKPGKYSDQFTLVFEDVFCRHIDKLIEKNDVQGLNRAFLFMENLVEGGDWDTRNTVELGILESLNGDTPEYFSKFEKYLGKKTKELCVNSKYFHKK